MSTGQAASDAPSTHPASTALPSGAELISEFVRESPFGAGMGLRVDRIEPDRARLVLPFHESVTTYSDVVHGGAITTLVDVAATAAAWSGVDASEASRGATIGLTVDFLRAARGADLLADGRVLRRGRSVCFCEVDVSLAGEPVAKGMVTYKLG